MSVVDKTRGLIRGVFVGDNSVYKPGVSNDVVADVGHIEHVQAVVPTARVFGGMVLVRFVRKRVVVSKSGEEHLDADDEVLGKQKKKPQTSFSTVGQNTIVVLFKTELRAHGSNCLQKS